MRWVLATNNAHKREELARMLEDLGVELLDAGAIGGMPEVDETGATFRENAFLKASALRERLEPGDWALADDSGLVVDSLDGAPGVHSARYAGPNATDSENVARLLRSLGGVPSAKRSARFVCVLCLLGRQENEPIFFEGTCEGRILLQPEGTEGFGYDPVFGPEGFTSSFAVLGAQVKDRMSHRARAIEALRAWILARREGGESGGAA